MNNKKPFYTIQSTFNEELLRRMFNHFYDLEWQSDKYNFGGKTVIPKRKTFMFGKNYSYSGNKKESIPFTLQVSFIAKEIEELLNLEENYFNGCLLNLYEDGEASISYHKDNEPEMEKDALIVSFSLGVDRKFYLKNDKDGTVTKLVSSNGSILVMEPSTQEEWKHSIPKEKKVKEPRISLTFRRFK